jgi:hypothetical protein
MMVMIMLILMTMMEMVIRSMRMRMIMRSVPGDDGATLPAVLNAVLDSVL